MVQLQENALTKGGQTVPILKDPPGYRHGFNQTLSERVGVG